MIFAATQPLAVRQADFRAGPFHVYKRPHLALFLAACFDWYEVAVWTSGSPGYAAEVVVAIFPEPDRLSFVWARDRCTLVYDTEAGERYARKPLAKVRRKGYQLESVIVVDDTPQKWEQSYGNLVRVKPFEGDEEDDELKRLLPYLDKLRRVEDVRTIEKRNWHIAEA